MSIVQIVEHNEVIYTILDKPPPEPPKPPRYHSQLERDLRESLKTRPQLARTFGNADMVFNDPSKYLRKGKGFAQPVKKSDHVHYTTGLLPPVPKCPRTKVKAPERPAINFKVENIKKAIKTKPKEPEPRLVDTRDGHIKKIKGSGEVPEYCKKEGFGKMPEYLLKRNRRIQKHIDKLRTAEENKESLCRLISEEERSKLLEDMKKNWARMQKGFLQQPMLIDTIPKIIRVTKLENELRQIEKDIALIESNPYIYVYP